MGKIYQPWRHPFFNFLDEKFVITGIRTPMPMMDIITVGGKKYLYIPLMGSSDVWNGKV
jgi:hypothetical protein